MRNTWLWVIVIIVLVILGFYYFGNRDDNEAVPNRQDNQQQTQQNPQQQQQQQSPQAVTVELSQQNRSLETGTATLTAQGNQTKVNLTITGQPKDVEQPAHIHSGSCPNPGAIIYTLNPPKNGSSETTINVPLSAILSRLPLAVNVHKSASEQNVYVSCGNIEASTVQSNEANTSKGK